MIGAKEIKLRIKGINNIQKITKAMQMVSAAKLRKFQSKAIVSRPYEYKLNDIVKKVRASVSGTVPHPLFAERAPKKVRLVIFTSDKGLCGAFNTNIIHHALTHMKNNSDKKFSLSIIGKKGYDFFKRRDYAIDGVFPQPSKDVTAECVEEIVHAITTGYSKAEYDEVYLLFTRFGTPMKSDPASVLFFPLRFKEEKSPVSSDTEQKVTPQTDILLEPTGEELLISLLPLYLKTQIYKALIESITSEHGARMVGMRTATDNAEEMLDELVLNYNRARQAAITTEILEVASGSEALK